MVVMAHGLNSVLKRGPIANGSSKSETKTGIGSRRIFPPHFKLQVLDSYRNDADCKGNQRATARKYGIHRRQIQKWLQAESNLRNSVGVVKGNKNECEARKCGIELALRSAGHRQRDDLTADAYSQSPSGVEARVPALSPVAYSESWVDNSPPQPPVPLDFTTHSRTDPPPPSDLSAPMDLSLKRPISITPGDPRAPVSYLPPNPTPSLCLAQRSTSPPLMIKPDPDIWDLSTNKRKYEEPPMHSPSSTVSSTTSKPVKLFKPYLDDLHDSSSSDSQSKSHDPPTCCYDPYYNNNNNNNIYEHPYSLHELQPKSFYYPNFNEVYLYPAHDAESYLYEGSQHPTPLKQRQSYSLDFKLSAIECYYRDEMCRGNQRAVATKYNIHRRQVQKWLKQEEELRQRIELKMHTVR